jgi:hypothetical protein
VDTISARDGGIVNFTLLGGLSNANRNYLLLGGVSGTEPGTLLPGGLATLPLNLDYFTFFVFSMLNTPLFMDFMGQLDNDGNAKAQFNTLDTGIVSPGCVGVILYWAYGVYAPWDCASNAVEVEIVE